MNYAKKATIATPFLRWVGGKGQLVEKIRPSFGKVNWQTATYHEPFLGGGAMFFAMRPKNAFLSDVNGDLVNAYRVLRDRPSALFSRLETLAKTHSKEQYYEVRSEVGYYPEMTAEEQLNAACRFIYLNKTCYNGLYRINASGLFNVPSGTERVNKVDQLKSANFDFGNLMECSQALMNTELRHSSIAASLELVKPGHILYLDPPYVPIAQKTNFNAYDRPFTMQDQRDLASRSHDLASKGATIVLSNAMTPETVELYEDCLSVTPISAARSVGGQGATRAKVQEVVVRF